MTFTIFFLYATQKKILHKNPLSLLLKFYIIIGIFIWMERRNISIRIKTCAFFYMRTIHNQLINGSELRNQSMSKKFNDVSTKLTEIYKIKNVIMQHMLFFIYAFYRLKKNFF